MTETRSFATSSVDVTGGVAPRPRLRTLTSLSFVAAMLVFVATVATESSFADAGVGNAVDDLVGPAARTGVSFFFVLGGFLLAWTARPGSPARELWRAFVTRTYPAHVLTALVAAVVSVTVAQVALDPAAVVANLFLVHSWFPDADITSSLNAPSWALSTALFLCAVFPLLLGLARRVRSNLLWAAAGTSMAVVVLTPLIGELLAPADQAWFLGRFPPAHLFEFVTGILVARIVMCGRWIRFGFAPAALLAAAGCVLTTVVPPHYTFGAVTILPFALLIGAAAHADVTGAPTGGLRSRVMVRLGEISFAFYLVHWLVVSFGHRVAGPGPWGVSGALGLAVLALAVSLALSWVLHTWMERPLVRAPVRSRRVAALPPESEALWSHKNCE